VIGAAAPACANGANAPPRTDSWTLTQRNIYIVPTGAGFVFALVLTVMLLVPSTTS